MRHGRDRSAVSFLVMGAALGLLVTLALLQYQWVGQLGEAERERLRVHLRASVLRCTQEFNGELMRLLAFLSAGRPVPPERELIELTERWQQWKDSTAHPELVRALYVAGDSDAGLGEIWIYRSAKSSFERIAWPEHLQGLRTRLAARAEERAPGGAPPWRAVMDEEGKTLIIPRWRGPLRGRPRRPEWLTEPRPGPDGWVIVELDTDFLAARLLPELVDRHFRRAEGFDFQVQVVRKADRRVIYRSDPSLPEQPMASPDASAGLLDLRPGLVRAFAEVNAAGVEGPVLAPGAPLRLEPEGRWQLLVKHRSGSLEAAVSRLRWRNLALSSGILILMAASLAMLIVSAQRSHRLARLQMEFVAGISHELRTPLAVICSAGDNLADGLVSDGEQARRYGALIRSEGRRLTEMVEQILSFAGAQAGRLNYQLRPVQVSELIGQAVAATAAAAQEAGVTVETQVEEGLPPLQADPAALSRCLRNLIANALQYAAAGKWVGLKARAVDGRRWIELRVEDRGPGICPADLPHIFEPFYRGRNASEGRVRGTGLGLSLARSVIQAHGGQINVQSRPGEGSVFIIRLPAAPAATQQSHA